MKKTFLILIIVFLFISCVQGEYDNVTYTISNESSQTVKFTFNDVSDIIITEGGDPITCIISSDKGRFAPEIDFDELEHPKSVILKTENKGTAGIFYTFLDNKRLTLRIENKLSIPVIVKADDFIDNEGQLTVKLREKENADAFIYTPSPNFLVEEADESERTIDLENPVFIPYPYPYTITFNWNLIDDDTINLTIR